jgi:hypothetical protein
VDAYERLRAAVLRAEPAAGPDRGIVRREGLAAWIVGLALVPAREEPVCCSPRPAPAPTLPSPMAANELTQLIAGILVTLAAEPAHA